MRGPIPTLLCTKPRVWWFWFWTTRHLAFAAQSHFLGSQSRIPFRQRDVYLAFQGGWMVFIAKLWSLGFRQFSSSTRQMVLSVKPPGTATWRRLTYYGTVEAMTCPIRVFHARSARIPTAFSFLFLTTRLTRDACASCKRYHQSGCFFS